MDHTAILQIEAGDCGIFVVGHEFAVFRCDAQSVNVKLALGGDAVVQMAGAALDVYRSVLGQLGNSLSYTTIQHARQKLLHTSRPETETDHAT